MVFLWFSYGFPWFSHGFPMVFPWFRRRFPKAFLLDLALGRLEVGPRAAPAQAAQEGRAAHADLDRCRGLELNELRSGELPSGNLT